MEKIFIVYDNGIKYNKKVNNINLHFNGNLVCHLLIFFSNNGHNPLIKSKFFAGGTTINFWITIDSCFV